MRLMSGFALLVHKASCPALDKNSARRSSADLNDYKEAAVVSVHERGSQDHGQLPWRCASYKPASIVSGARQLSALCNSKPEETSLGPD